MNTERLFEALDTASVYCLAAVVHFLWQGAVVALLTAGVLTSLRRASAAVRYGVAVAGLALMAICPVLTIGLSAKAPPVATASVAAVSPELAVSPANDPAEASGTSPAVADAPAPAPSAPPAATAAASQPLPVATLDEPGWKRFAPAVAGIYAAGVLLLLGRLLLGLHGGRRLCQQARAVKDASLLAALDRQVRAFRLRAAPLLAVCPQVVVPTVVGILRPTILLPLAIVAGLTPRELEAILAHELAHLRRYDHLVNLLQRLIEAFLFFHPAVWWLSRRIRIEREHCCDDRVVALGTEPRAYAASLLHVAELVHATTGPRPVVVGVHAVRSPSTLRQRIARVLGVQDEPAVRLTRAWPLVAALALGAILIVPALLPSEARQTMIQAATDNQGPGWGDASGGLRARMVPVVPGTDEQKPDPAVAATPRYTNAEDVTFVVELQNVSDKPITLQGTRYGDAVAPPWPGKSVSETFAAYLFDCEFLDKNGKPLNRPMRAMLEGDTMLTLNSGLAETIAPGKSLVCLIRPTHWDSSTARLLTTGDYQVRLRYHGTPPAVQADIKRHWPDNKLGAAWSGNVAAGPVSFTIADAPENRRPAVVWGPASNGLQAAAEYQSAARTPQGRRDTASATYPHGTRLNVQFLIKNVSDKDISFWSELGRQEDKTILIDIAGNETTLGHAWYSGWARVERWTLKPGQIAVLSAIGLGIADAGKNDKAFDHPIGGIVAIKPGLAKLRHEVRFNGWQRTNKDGQQIPGKDDWQGTLITGDTPITVRARKAEDEPPTFTARLRFRSAEGKPVESGQVTVYRQSGMRSLVKGDLKPGAFEVPNCPFEALLIEVRAPGFEETRIYDVAVAPDRETTLTLKPAEPLRFRLATREGKPVAGAKVRYFIRSKDKASAGPYPMNGLTGPVWATSNADGEVVVDSLQKFDPLDLKLGNNIYWFYVEPPALAPFFIGPVQAGQDLGKLTVSPLLEVRGEVHGTPAQLDAFAAEWDQPVPMKRGNGEDSWHYAISKRLETIREGDKLTFHLTGLSPGTLRIISRFKQGGKPISHEYSRRKPNEDDVVLEVQLTESRNDLVVTNRMQEPKKP